MKVSYLQLITINYLILQIFFSGSAFASSDWQQMENIINHKLTVEKQGVGVAMALLENGKIHYVLAGDANRASGEKVNRQTGFEIGSLTKTFTAMALADMVNDGQVKLNDPISKYFPANTKLPSSTADIITLKSLANHTSGLPRLPGNLTVSDPQDPYADYTTEMMLDYLAQYPLTQNAGEAFEYSNLGMGLLGYLLSEIDGTDYESLIKHRVLAPLQMDASYVGPNHKKAAQLAQGYDNRLSPTKHWDLPALAGAGALKSNIEDMASYLRAQMGNSDLTQTVELTHQKTLNISPDTSIGLGWLESRKTPGRFFHDGQTGGFRSFMAFDKEQGRGIVILSNSVFGLEELGFAYLDASLHRVDLSKPVTVMLADLKNLVGEYALVPGFTLTVTIRDQHLYIQGTGQQALKFTALSNTEFVNHAVKARIKFTLGRKGKASSVTLFQGGQSLEGLRM